jgi:hypothetical protein
LAAASSGGLVVLSRSRWTIEPRRIDDDEISTLDRAPSSLPRARETRML